MNQRSSQPRVAATRTPIWRREGGLEPSTPTSDPPDVQAKMHYPTRLGRKVRLMNDWKRTLYIMFVAQLLSAVGFSSIFPFLSLYVDELGSSTGMSLSLLAGLVFSSQAVTMMIASPIWGSVADRYGRKLMVERAMFGGAVIILLMAFVQSAEQLVILRAIQGLVTGVVSAANTLVAATAPREQTGYAMGFLQVGLWSGVAIGPIIGGVMQDAYGPESAFIVTAALLFAGGVLVAFGVKEDFTPMSGARGRMRLIDGWRHVMASPGVATVFLIRFMGWLGRNVLIPFAPLFIATLLVNDARVGTVTGLMIGIASAAGTASAIYLGKLGDRIGHKQVLVVSALVAAAVYLPQALVQSAWQLLALQALTGAAVGGVMPSLSALLNHYTDPGEAGAVYGLDNSIVAGARAVAPLLGAALVFLFGFRSLFVIASLMFGVTALLALWYLPDTGRQAQIAAAPGD